MKNIILSVDIESRAVVTSKNFAGISGEHLQNDIVVKFCNNEFVDGIGYFEVIIDDQKYAIQMEKNVNEKTYSIPVKSSLLRKAGNLICQFTVRSINEVGIFKSVRFSLPVLYGINAIDTIEDDYKTWAQQVEEDIENLNDNVDEVQQDIVNINDNITEINQTIDEIIEAQKTYIFEQALASTTWEIAHNLNKYPSVTVVDSAGDIVLCNVNYVDKNNIRLVFEAEFGGKAYLN